MKILIMTSLWGRFGGKEQYLQCCVDQFTRMGHQCAVACGTVSAAPDDAAAPSIPVYEIPAYSSVSSPGDAASESKMASVLCAEAPDVIFMCDLRNLRLLAMLKKHGGLVTMSHDHWLVCQRGTCISYFRGVTCERSCSYCRVRHALMNHSAVLDCYREMDIHVVASNYMKSRLVQQGFDPDRVRVIGLFTELTPAESSSQDDQKPLVVFAGRIDPPKGVDYLLRALRQVSAPFRCAIIGDGEHRLHCGNLAHQLGIADSVEFTGWLSRERLAEKLTASSMVVVPSIWPEPFCLVGLEAMTCSKPVVAFDTGGIADWLKEGVNGYLIPPRNTESLAGTIDSLLQNRQHGAKMGAAGRRIVDTCFSKGRHFEQLLGAFHQVARNEYSEMGGEVRR